MERVRPVILLVEDDQSLPINHATVSEVLTSEGFDVLRAQCGATAVASAQSNAPDLVLTDVMLPRDLGRELAVALKAQARTADVPIVALTGETDSADWDKAAPWDASLSRPCLPEELVACIKSLLYDRARKSSRTLRAASVS